MSVGFGITNGHADAPGGFTTVEVTNTDATGAGSLHAAVDGVKSDRRVVFTVGGTIALTDDINVEGSYVTIDGSTGWGSHWLINATTSSPASSAARANNIDPSSRLGVNGGTW